MRSVLYIELINYSTYERVSEQRVRVCAAIRTNDKTDVAGTEDS